MEFLPNETHGAELNIPGAGMIMVCVDGSTNPWRLEPDHMRLDDTGRAEIAATLQAEVARQIQLRGYRPNHIPMPCWRHPSRMRSGRSLALVPS